MERWFSRMAMFWMLFLGEVQSQNGTKCSTDCTCDENKMSVTCKGLKNVPNDIQKDAKKLDLKYNSLSKLDPTAFHGLSAKVFNISFKTLKTPPKTDPDGVTCRGTMESVNKITKENTFQAGCPTTTQQMATSPASTTTTEIMTVQEKQTKPRMKIFQEVPTEELFSKASIFFCQVIFTQHVSLVVIHILAEILLLHIVCVVRK
uniref:Uncharacterized protein n=1 Tax=Eptatretus burgeri TaxID=7764 RepID=A0A8C4NLC6_EPTBU